jgi:hypothetical protein
MRVRLRFAAVGPDINRDAGDVVDFPAEQALQLIKDQMADAFDPMPVERADASRRPETTETKTGFRQGSPNTTGKP